MRKSVRNQFSSGGQLQLLAQGVARREIPDDVSYEQAKSCVLKCPAEPVERNFCGTLTVDNIEGVAERMRLLLPGLFAVVSVRYVDSGNSQLYVDTDCRFNSEWTDGTPEMVRVFRCEEGRDALSFSAGGYLYTFHAAPTDDHEDFRYCYVSFEDNTVRFKERAPAGHLHLHCFAPQGS